jgi:hypothetical protein
MNDSSEKLVKLINQRLDKTSKYYVEKEDIEVVQMKGCKGAGLKKVGNIYLPIWVNNLALTKKMKIRSDDVRFSILIAQVLNLILNS